jgi:hypothetical protein
MLDFVDEPLDQIALLVEVFVVGDRLRTRAARWNDSLGADLRDRGTKAIRIEAHVGEQVFEGKAADQAFSLANVVDLACGQDEADGIAEGVDADVDLGAQPAARTPDRLIFAPPFLAPAAC